METLDLTFFWGGEKLLLYTERECVVYWYSLSTHMVAPWRNAPYAPGSISYTLYLQYCRRDCPTYRVGNGEKSRVGNDAWKKRYTLMEEMPPLPPFPPFRGY